MKKFFRFTVLPVILLALLVLLQGCLKDSYRESYKIYVPTYQSLTEVRAAMKSGPAQALQNTGKLNVYGNYIFLNELNKGIHVIDNSNPSAPKNVSFIPIPNNVDIAVRGSYLYADMYSDIVVFDLSQPANIRPVKFLNNVIKDKNRYWMGTQTNPDSIKVVTGYTEKDTTVSYAQYRIWNNCANCMYAAADFKMFFSVAPPQVGVTGSMSRFSIVNDYLYAVSTSELYTLSLSNPTDPQLTNTESMGWNIETIYPFAGKLFIGSQTGMFIYSLSNPAAPVQLSRFAHATRCDPVIADNNFAYVTLRSGTTCNGTTNELDVIDISDLTAPMLRTTMPMVNPHGLSKDGKFLLVCDGKEGLKLYDATEPLNMQLKQQQKGLETYDVIAMNGNAIVVAKDGLYQFAYGNNGLTQLSKLSIAQTN